MNIKDIISKYKNPDLCEKWGNNIPANELEGEGYYLQTDSQDIDYLCGYFMGVPLPVEDITGFIVTVADGDYGEVYVTESSRPYSLDAIYHPLDYYL